MVQTFQKSNWSLISLIWNTQVLSNVCSAIIRVDACTDYEPWEKDTTWMWPWVRYTGTRQGLGVQMHSAKLIITEYFVEMFKIWNPSHLWLLIVTAVIQMWNTPNPCLLSVFRGISVLDVERADVSFALPLFWSCEYSLWHWDDVQLNLRNSLQLTA